MKKIMFNDKYGLTAAVLEGRKTMTRRIIKAPRHTIEGKEVCGFAVYKTHEGIPYEVWLTGPDEESLCQLLPTYHIGEEVAVAQKYIDLKDCDAFYECMHKDDPYMPLECIKGEKGAYNKMFVKAAWMPHRIKITNIKVERLQDISDKDCIKEGIIPITWRQYLKQDLDDLSPQKHVDHNVYTLEKFRRGIEDPWSESDPDEYMAEDAHTAFAVLIMKMMGKKVWDANPYVFAYEFQLIK